GRPLPRPRRDAGPVRVLARGVAPRRRLSRSGSGAGARDHDAARPARARALTGAAESVPRGSQFLGILGPRGIVRGTRVLGRRPAGPDGPTRREPSSRGTVTMGWEGRPGPARRRRDLFLRA